MGNDESRLQKLEDLAVTRAETLKREFEAKVSKIKDRIRSLENEKRSIEKGKISKEETILRLKEDLENGRKQWVMENFVLPTARTYQSQVRSLQNLDHLRIHEFGGGQGIMRFIYSWITPGMIDEAAKTLEDGPSLRERESKIEELNRQIGKAEEELEKLLG